MGDKEETASSSEKAKKKMGEKKTKAAEKEQKAAKKRTKEGWIQKAAEDRFAAYKAKMKAAKLQHLLAQGKATASDVKKADIAVRVVALASRKSERLALVHNRKKLPGSAG